MPDARRDPTAGDGSKRSEAPEPTPSATASLLRRLAALSPRETCAWGLALAGAIEALTCVLRFGFELESHVHTSAMAPFTFGLRVHHGYWGILLLVIAAFVKKRRAFRNALLVLGLGLFVSDVVHHFLVLWPITGSPEFYLMYD